MLDKNNISGLVAQLRTLNILRVDGECIYTIVNNAATKIEELHEALVGMCEQFAGWSDKKGGYLTNGLSSLELAFDVLGWEEPSICKEAQCDEPGCKKQIICGWPSSNGYRSTCGEHYRKEN